MNRLLCIGTLSTIAMLQFLKIADPQSLLFDVVSVGQGATFIHILFASLLLLIGVQEYFTYKPVRVVAGLAGIGLIALGVASMVYPILDTYLKPFDLVFMLEAGIIFSLVGISVSEEAEQEAMLLRQYEIELDSEKTANDSRRKIAYN